MTTPLLKKFSLRRAFAIATIGLSGLGIFGYFTRSTFHPAWQHKLDHSKTTLFQGETHAFWGFSKFWALQMAAHRQYIEAPQQSDTSTYRVWIDKIDKLGTGKDIYFQACLVQGLTNLYLTYKSDAVVYNTPEYWASAVESINLGKGDCEDFAIAKFYALKHLNVPESRYCLMTIAHSDKAKAIKYRVDHAVLAVDTSAANNWEGFLILDNSGEPTFYKNISGEIRGYITPQEFGGISLPEKKKNPPPAPPRPR